MIVAPRVTFSGTAAGEGRVLAIGHDSSACPLSRPPEALLSHDRPTHRSVMAGNDGPRPWIAVLSVHIRRPDELLLGSHLWQGVCTSWRTEVRHETVGGSASRCLRIADGKRCPECCRAERRRWTRRRWRALRRRPRRRKPHRRWASRRRPLERRSLGREPLAREPLAWWRLVVAGRRARSLGVPLLLLPLLLPVLLPVLRCSVLCLRGLPGVRSADGHGGTAAIAVDPARGSLSQRQVRAPRRWHIAALAVGLGAEPPAAAWAGIAVATTLPPRSLT
jgi:hypothetical protein